MRQVLVLLLLLPTVGCSTTISFGRPDRCAEEQDQLRASLDPRLAGLIETVRHDVCTINVEVGRAIQSAVQDDRRSRVHLALGDSWFGPGGDLGSLFAGNFETTYTLCVLVTADDREPQCLVATGRAASSAATRAVQRAVENCVADLRTQLGRVLSPMTPASVAGI